MITHWYHTGKNRNRNSAVLIYTLQTELKRIHSGVRGLGNKNYICCPSIDLQVQPTTKRESNRANFVSSAKFVANNRGNKNRLYCRDTGASLSIFHLSIINGITIDPTPVSLTTANRNKIKCFSQAYLEIGIPPPAIVSLDLRTPKIQLLVSFRTHHWLPKKISSIQMQGEKHNENIHNKILNHFEAPHCI